MATDSNTVKQYNLNAVAYDKHVSDPNDSIYHSYYEKPAIRAELPTIKDLEVISLGCGSGVDARWLSDNGAKKVVGIDISDGLLAIAKKNHPDIEFYEMDMEHLDFEDDSFDLAYSSLAIHYVDNWTQSLREAYRVLRQDGTYVFSCGHPIDDSMEYATEGDSKYARLGRKVDQVTKKRTIYGDYLAKTGGGVKPIKGTLGGIDIVVYHRTFSKMIEEILASGFKIKRLVEPQPVKEMQKFDEGTHEQLTRIPTFMVWVLGK